MFDGQVHVHYGQLYVESDENRHGPDMDVAFWGQRNGLCGAGDEGALFLITGLHTGYVGFTAEVHDHAPPLDDAWEEIVEVFYRPTSSEIRLVQWAAEDSWPLEINQVDYRVRYCATGMDAAHQEVSGHDRYLLQFWPDRATADAVIKQTSETAAYWHRWARQRPTDVKPRRWTPPDGPPQRAGGRSTIDHTPDISARWRLPDE